ELQARVQQGPGPRLGVRDGAAFLALARALLPVRQARAVTRRQRSFPARVAPQNALGATRLGGARGVRKLPAALVRRRARAPGGAPDVELLLPRADARQPDVGRELFAELFPAGTRGTPHPCAPRPVTRARSRIPSTARVRALVPDRWCGV